RIDRQDVSARRGGRGAPFTGREYASEGGYADGQDHREAVMGRAPERGPGAVPDAAKTDEATMPDTSQKTYWDYLSLLPLLELQGGLEGDDRKLSEDELHFIIVHQVFELWLKLVLRELAMARDGLIAEWVPEKHLPHIVRHLRRVIEIFKLSIDSF